MEITTARWSEADFLREREAVFAAAPAGLEVDLDEAAGYLRSLPPERFWRHAIEEAGEKGSVVVFPRLGYGDIEAMVTGMRRIRDEGGAGGASIHIDSYTRWHRYEKAAQLVEQGLREGRNLLNGYPIVYYGVTRTRELLEAVNMPVSTVAGSQDARLFEELMIAAGVPEGSASIVPPPFSFTDNKISLEEALWLGLYTDRLLGWYVERGIPMLCNVRGCNCGTGRPPSLNMALTLVEILAAVEQGCRDFEITYYLNGSFLQDIAYLRTIVPMAERYVRRAGYTDCRFYINGSHYDGVFPVDPAEAMAVLCYQGLVARLAGVHLFHTKTLEEGAQLPSIDAHVQTCKAMRCIMDILGNSRYPEEPLAEESEMIELEVDALMDNMFALGNGDILRGFVDAFKTGTMEFPFSPSKFNRGEVVVVRDANGAARFLDVGQLPIPERAMRYHQQQLERSGSEEADPLELMFRSIRYLGAFQVVK